jgi:hypothetical protein
MKEGSLFVLFVCQIEIFPNPNASCHVLGTVGEPWISKGAPSWFRNVSTYDGEKLLNIEQIFFIENSFKSKLKIIKEFWSHFCWYCWKALSE